LENILAMANSSPPKPEDSASGWYGNECEGKGRHTLERFDVEGIETLFITGLHDSFYADGLPVSFGYLSGFNV
jgi:hypothetical protein